MALGVSYSNLLTQPELAFRQGNEIYLREGRSLVSPSVKSDILERLAEAMFFDTAYLNDAEGSAGTSGLVSLPEGTLIIQWNVRVAAKSEIQMWKLPYKT